jgi:2-keto-4-pentenoate hydratase/2-oxohepta-3-ene-1,7-dioic acid hydratase in catechol pathway
LAPVPVPAQIRDFSSFEKHVRGAPAGMQVLRARLAGGNVPAVGSIKIEPAEVYFKQPVYYISNRFNVIGPDADVTWPNYCDYLDFELEFGVFIGRKGKNLTRAQAREHIFGYAIFNDFSARDRQMVEMAGFMGPAKGKSFDTGNAIGPWIVTPDEIPDPGALKVTVRVNGEVWAQSTTASMLHGFDEMVAFVSQSETLYPGEFFGSGTVGGCCGLEMDRWLKPGDVVELDVERLGVLRNRVVRGSA